MVAERENIQVTEEKELLQQRTQGSRNEMEIVFDAVSCNESFARVAVAAFITHLNPTLEELADIKTAVSEAMPLSMDTRICPVIRSMGRCARRTALSIRER